jgi:CRP/FNR family cyclic AMP-dependent transcriptional regulator
VGVALLPESSSDALIDSESIFAASARPASVSLLAADPDLGQALDGVTAARARRAAYAPVTTVEPGVWRPHLPDDLAGAIGMFVISGSMCRSVVVGSEESCEMLGPGDLLRPWVEDQSDAIPTRPQYEVLEPSTVALLDRAFAQRIARFPELFAELTDRAVRRCRAQAMLAATTHIKRVDVRLLAVFFHLAERWGRVTPDGIVVPLPLTHSRLAALVGAQRPSVTTALRRMAEREVLTRNAARHYVLGQSAWTELEEFCLCDDARHRRVVHPPDAAMRRRAAHVASLAAGA